MNEMPEVMMPSDLAAWHDAVQRAGLVPGLHLGQLLPQAPVRRPGVGGDHDPRPDVALEARRRGARPVSPRGCTTV